MKFKMKFLLLCLAGMVSFTLFSAEKVVPRKRYRATFEARATKNVVPEDFRCQNAKLDYPGVELQFTDKKNRKYVRLARGSFFNLHSREFVPGLIEFYAGEGIKLVKLVPKNAEVRNVKIVPVKNDSNLAIPLDYRVSGQVRDFFLTPGKIGEAVYDVCDGKIYGDPFPIQGGKRYRLTVNGYAGVTRALRVGVEFYTHDRGGKAATVRSSRTQIQIGGKKQQVVYDFKAPDKASWMRVTMMWGFVKSYKVEAIQ